MDKQRIKNKIQEKIVLNSDEIEELKLLTRPIAPENAIGRVSRMDAINNKAINDRALFQAKDKLRKLELSLARVNDKDFGKCRSCNGEIQEGRLLLMPESNTCVSCASKK